jgi:hypothetical protein
MEETSLQAVTSADSTGIAFERFGAVAGGERGRGVAAGYDLRAADAIHLPTALVVLEADSLFVTWDRRLRGVAVQAGLVSAPAGA